MERPARVGTEGGAVTSPAQTRAMIAAHLYVEPERVTDEATFVSLGADSLDGIELAMAFEDKFGVEIGDDFITESTTVGDAVKAIEDLLAKRDPQLVGGVEF